MDTQAKAATNEGEEEPRRTPDEARIEQLLNRRKKVTINDVAAVCGVSKKTVSRIINDSPNVKSETRAIVNDVIRRLSFKPDPQARGLAFRRAFLIGLVYDNPNAQYVVNMQMGILDHLRGTGNELVVHPCGRNSPTLLSEIRDFIELQRLSGVILLPPIAENEDLLTLMEELGVAYIRVTALAGEDSDPPIASSQIVSLDAIGCTEAGEHLARLGHRRIAYIAGNLAYPSAHVRRRGFDEGLRRHGLAIAPDLDMPGDYSFESGYSASVRILNAAEPPTAIICCNDEMAAGAYKAAYERGIAIPGDLSIVSFDDSPLASRLSPGLSSVRLPIRDMGKQAAAAVIGPDAHKQRSFVFGSTFIERPSSGPPRR